MFHILPRKESLRLFLRRHIINATIEREQNQIRCLHDCLENPKPHRSKTWLLLIIPVCYIMYVLALNIVANDEDHSKITAQTLQVNGSSLGPHNYGRQLSAPVRTTTEFLEVVSSLDGYSTWEDILLNNYLVKTELLLINRKNMFTPRPKLEITEIPLTSTERISQDHLPVCKLNNRSIENITLNLGAFNKSLDQLFPMVREGGIYSPRDCRSRYQVAVLVPYRNRTENLRTFLMNIHPILMAQKLEYRIFVIEQHGDNMFNKGKLLNAGFKAMRKLGHWPCVILHDVDLLPLNTRVSYSCSAYPRMMSNAVYFTNGSYNNISEVPPRFGGVAAITTEHYELVNGHSNLYWGWGIEDVDMYLRLRAANLRITKNSKSISRFVHLPHAPESNEEINRSLLLNAKNRYKFEGLSTLTCAVLNVTYHHLFTHVLVALNEIQPS